METKATVAQLEKKISKTPLWSHKKPESTRIWEFKENVQRKYGLELETYEALWQWSINNLNAFWSEVWHFTGVKASKPYTEVCYIGKRQLYLCQY